MAGTHLREGRPAEEIADLAEELGADLVVVGSRGLGTIERLTTGSVSEGVAQLAPCPTLVVRGAWPPSKVVVGDDSTEAAKRAGDLAASIGRLFDVRVLLVRVYQHPMLGATGAPDLGGTEEASRLGDDSLERRAAELEGVLGTPPEVEAAAGDAAASIQELAEEGAEPALVAVGSRGTGIVGRFALGSVSTDVLRAVGGPVLIVPSPEARGAPLRSPNPPRS